MILRQKIALVSTSTIIGLMILFPPYVIKSITGIKGMTIKAGHGFVFDLPTYIKDTVIYDASIGDIVPYTMDIPATVNVSMLVAQIFGALVIGGAFYYVLRS